MYLTHHYFIDLIFGAALSLVFFTYVKYAKLPVIDPLKYCRWSYSELKRPNLSESDPLNSFIPLHNDLEAGDNMDFFNHPRFNETSSENIEMNAVNRSRDNLMRAPLSRASSISPLGINTSDHSGVQDFLEGETDHSVAESVFDADGRAGEVQVSVTTSNTSLNDMLSSKSGFAKSVSKQESQPAPESRK